ncbi:MAG: FtsX-like permease family protein [Cytophagales bacterium]|nr:FtsX-like permease family protein [Cytophagales bacterium]
MNIFKLSWKNLLVKPLNTGLSILLLMLGVAMISLLMLMSSQLEEQFKKNITGIDMVVGAKGSPLQLILSAVFQVDNPTGNISLAEAEELKKNRLIALGIPLSYGDSYRGYRIVGTTSEYLDLYDASLQEGRVWQKSLEVVIGSKIAVATGLKLGDEFASAHGFAEGGDVHDHSQFKVVGVLERSNSVVDQLLLTATESIWDVHNHDGAEADDDPQITAMLIKFRGPMGIIRLPRMVNEETNMQAAVPSFEMSRLIGLMGVGIDTLNLIAYLVMIVSAISIFISLYNAIKERRYEMALMRSYGATARQLFLMVVLEGVFLAVLGIILGTLTSRAGLLIVSGLAEERFHFDFNNLAILSQEYYLFGACMAIGFVASVIPAIQALRIDISRALAEG